MRAILLGLVVLVLLAPIGGANRNLWLGAGPGESNDCDALYDVTLSRAQAGTFRWNIVFSITPDVRGAQGNARFDCADREYTFQNVVAGDHGPWVVNTKTGTASCPNEQRFTLEGVPLEHGGPAAVSYRVWTPCHGVFDFGSGTVVMGAPEAVSCISLLCRATT